MKKKNILVYGINATIPYKSLDISFDPTNEELTNTIKRIITIILTSEHHFNFLNLWNLLIEMINLMNS